MKYCLTFLAIIVIAISSTTTVQAQSSINNSADIKAAENTVKAFFEAISDYDFQKIRNLTSDDFRLIEDGPILSVNEFIALAKKYQEKQAAFSYEFSNMETNVEGKTAWMTYKNHGVMTIGDKERHFNWTESAVFSKTDNGWEIVLLHSTVNEQDSNKQK